MEFESRSGSFHAVDEGEAITLESHAWRGRDGGSSRAAHPGDRPLPRRRCFEWMTTNYCVVLESEDEVRALAPDFAALAELHPQGPIVSAPGRTAVFVSRYFAPSYGIPEDPATGADAACWRRSGERLGKRRPVAHQASPRGGDMVRPVSTRRVALTREAHLFLEGRIFLPDAKICTFSL